MLCRSTHLGSGLANLEKLEFCQQFAAAWQTYSHWYEALKRCCKLQLPDDPETCWLSSRLFFDTEVASASDNWFAIPGLENQVLARQTEKPNRIWTLVRSHPFSAEVTTCCFHSFVADIRRFPDKDEDSNRTTPTEESGTSAVVAYSWGVSKEMG